MPHKADQSFFQRKLTWSRRKDLILEHYLRPYLPKVGKLRKPILIVDGFAGRGAFLDGNPGSPLIIAGQIAKARDMGVTVPIRLLAVEKDKALYSELHRLLAPIDFAVTRHASFLDVVPEIETAASSHTVFLYLDPYAVEGIEWTALDRIFRHVFVSGSSVEVLLNFNVAAFARRGRACFRLPEPEPEVAVDVEGQTDDREDWQRSIRDTPSAERLDSIVGGDWWHNIVRLNKPFAEEVQLLTDGFCGRLRQRFNEVCVHPIKARVHHQIPKYVLVFGTRYQPAIELMHDAAVRSRELFAHEEAPAEPTLFETRPVELLPDTETLPDIVTAACSRRMSRDALIQMVIRQAFGEFPQKAIRAAIEQELASGRLRSKSGRVRRIPGREMVWRT